MGAVGWRETAGRILETGLCTGKQIILVENRRVKIDETIESKNTVERLVLE